MQKKRKYRTVVHTLNNGNEILFDKVKSVIDGTSIRVAPRGNLVFESREELSKDKIRDHIGMILNANTAITIIEFFTLQLKTIEVNSFIVIIETGVIQPSKHITISTQPFFYAGQSGQYKILPQYKLNKKNPLFLGENKIGKHHWISIDYIIKQIGGK